MDIRNRRAVRAAASETLRCNTGDPRMVAVVYAAVFAGVMFLDQALQVVLLNRINETGGLGDLGLRSILTTIQSCLPPVRYLVLALLALGYRKATLSVVRHSAVAPRDLTGGFRFFGPMLRAALIQAGIYLLMSIFTLNVAFTIFLMTPFAAQFIELAKTLPTDYYTLINLLATDMDLCMQVFTTAVAMPIIWLALFGAVASPFFYGCRMVSYVLVEQPGTGAMAAILESNRMMRGNRAELLKYDLGFWWYYLTRFLLVPVLVTGVMMLVVGPSWTFTALYLAVCGLYFLLDGVAAALMMNRVEVTYATFYDLIRPKPQAPGSGGAVLGNIFDLAKEYKED